MEKYCRALFDEHEVPEEIRQKLWNKYFDKLSTGIDKGYNAKDFEVYDKELVKAFKTNIAEFSAFKETSFRNSLHELLTTEDGRLRSWNDFKTEALKVSGDYNVRWLETEYHQTVANANMAGKWKDFERDTDLYSNVKFVTVADGRVRPEHKVLDGVVRPYNDPFWKTHLPPLDWGCRCNVIQTDEEPTEVPGGVQLKLEFENNPAQSGKIFNGSVYEKGLNGKEKKEIADNAIRWLESTQKKDGKVTFAPNYDTNDFNRNKYIAEVCAKQTGFNFHIREHVEVKHVTNPEYLIGDLLLGDRKSIKSSNGIITQIDHAKKQMLNKFVNPHKMPYYIVWDLDAIENIEWSEITNNLSRKVTKTRGTKIRGMFFHYQGKAVYLPRENIVKRDYSVLEKLK
ncbi:phage putative head morphogenesis protein, SPP1 gp7 family [Riemerella columbipharyngis]|uniref:Phage putative head morphogenesis protein, SPP1 gp7 family n=1 Tax=Riemerella columbipharyngis TaxID=1071918 RepID=A0A1G7FLC2_9FLAO|nr:phage putative head morphogenesis protein, SPP1 gp7 family [Riemerella columbipharyngis]